ncbi:glycine cleavage system protein H [Streptomyces sp. NPDC052721]|uniref:glycine cleavage system protein H n=1 Tax=Streptomyces sp. NPDC052721 TaxID=3154955 RepID=UPI00343E20FE
MDKGDATVGITAYAAESSGDVVDLRLPEAGSWVEAGEARGRISSPTAVSELYAPAFGRVLEVDTALARDPGAISAAPCTGGRLFRLRAENTAGALSADAYAAHIRGARR